MTPTTDDIVQALLETLGEDASAVLSSDPVSDAGAMTADVLPFSPQKRRSFVDGPAEVTDLSMVRNVRQKARTHSGVFHYVPRL